MAEQGGKEAVLSCPICYYTFGSRMQVMSCGHTLCEACMENIQNSREHKGKCPICKVPYQRDTYTLFPELAIVDGTSTNKVLQRTRQRVVHVINPLGVMSSAEEIRDAYNTAREHRAQIRNMATGCNNPDFETLTIAVTDAVDALEERLHYSLQKQDLADSIVNMKKKLKSEKLAHETAQNALAAQVAQLKEKYRHEEKERAKAKASLDKYRERLNTITVEQKQQSRQVERQAMQIKTFQAALSQTTTERNTFQGQLEEYRKKTVKQRALITQLKQEVEELKSKPTSKPAVHKIKAPPQPRLIEWPSPGGAGEIVVLSSSSPTHTPSAQPPAKRKHRLPHDENRSRSFDDLLLPPPKVRLGNPRKPQVQDASTDIIGVYEQENMNKSSAALGRHKPQPSTIKNASGSHLSLGQGGKLVAVVKKRKLPAV